MSRSTDAPADSVPRSYWLLAATLVAYVALCTEHRENVVGTDGWEHHRAFKALTENISTPGNPTFAIDTPSARYTPYSVFWATVCRVTGLDSYRALSLAATVNTVVLVLAVPFFLSRFGEARSATAALLIMISLYGGSPGTSSTYALADLPWHQVNFSAASFGWVLVLLGVFQGFARGDWGIHALPVLVVLSAMTMIDHGMTGTWGQFSLWLLALTAPADRRWRLAATVLVIQVLTLLLCLGWPWFNFLTAMTIKTPSRIVPYGLQVLMVTRWCMPAVLLGVLAFVCRDRPAVRVFLIGGYLFFLSGLLIFVLPIRFPLVSSVSRYPMPGLVYLHMALGILAYQAGLFRPSTWPARLRTLVRGDRGDVAQAAGEVLLACSVVYFLVPQLIDALREPHLLRPYLARIAGKENKQLDLLAQYRSLLRDVGRLDVVLSDEDTMWPVPSVNGRIVHALHAEMFVPEEEDSRRRQDTLDFFDPKTTDAQRVEILERYNVRWIILTSNPAFQKPEMVARLLREPAVVRREGPFILMDATLWIATTSAEPTPKAAEAVPAPSR